MNRLVRLLVRHPDGYAPQDKAPPPQPPTPQPDPPQAKDPKPPKKTPGDRALAKHWNTHQDGHTTTCTPTYLVSDWDTAIDTKTIDPYGDLAKAMNNLAQAFKQTNKAFEMANHQISIGTEELKGGLMPGKDLTRWTEIAEDVWVRNTGETAQEGIKATKAAVAKAGELGVDLSTVTGTGSGGQITIGDVIAAAA